jgi:hypothetical protein
VQVAILFFQRYKFIFKKLRFSSVHLIKFFGKDSFVQVISALLLAVNVTYHFKMTDKALIFSILILIFGCSRTTDQTTDATIDNVETTDYNGQIEKYLETKRIEPTLILNNNERTIIEFLDNKIRWQENEKGIEITINGKTINTVDKITLNNVWGEGKDSVKFANYVSQVKLYEYQNLIGFMLTYVPCTGLGCGVNYQVWYDTKTESESYFGRFNTGFDLELYDFNNDNKVDYLSKTFNGRNATLIDTTLFEMFSQTEDGKFAKFRNDKGDSFWFKHIYSESDSIPDKFEEKWVDQIIEKR